MADAQCAYVNIERAGRVRLGQSRGGGMKAEMVKEEALQV